MQDDFRPEKSSTHLGELFPSQKNFIVDELVLFGIQYIHDGRPVIPIFERKLVAEAH